MPKPKPRPCPHCGVSPEDVKDGHVELYNEWADANMPVAVNAVAGCLCRPEDFEGPRVPTQEELDELPF